MASHVKSYRRAVELLQSGDLKAAREQAEEALEECAVSVCPPLNMSGHMAFVDALLLLSNIYSAALNFTEAERLLVTCTGYVKDSFRLSSSPVNAKGTSAAEDSSAERQVKALTTINYNRGVLCVDEYMHFRSIGGDVLMKERPRLIRRIQEARDTYLTEAESGLENCLGNSRLLLADVWHTKGVCYQLLGKYVEALSFFKKSLELRLCCATSIVSSDILEMKILLTWEHVFQVYQLFLGSPSALSSSGLSVAMTHNTLQQGLRLISETRVRVLGSQHPLVARALFYEGVYAAQRGRTNAAANTLRDCQRALNSITCADERQTQLLGLPVVEEVVHWLNAVTEKEEHRNHLA